jgi:hypothetical protein
MDTGARQRLNIATIVCVGLPAFGLESVAHEVLGHSVTAWLTGAKVVLISSTAMQTQGGSRLVPASGPLANLLFGVLAYLALRRIPRMNAARLFLWLFAFANLFLGTAYILYSGLINFGDSAYVIAGLQPTWLYRAALIVFGAWGYRFSVRLAARDLAGLIREGSLLLEDVPRILYPSCVGGALLYFAASLFNPISPSLILYDGVAMAFGVAYGLVRVALAVQGRAKDFAASPVGEGTALSAIPFSAAWVAFGSIFAVLFVFFLGRGIRP